MSAPTAASGADAGQVLVVAAAASETRYLPADVEVVLTGLGKTAAAVATTRALAERAASQRVGLTVVNLGSCGALRPGLRGVYEPGVVLNHDISADAIRALGHDPHERLAVGSGDPSLVLATGDLFVADPAVRDALATRASIVDMEGYAVVRACQEFGVGVRVVKHVSDDADASALDWNEAVDASARDLANWWRQGQGTLPHFH